MQVVASGRLVPVEVPDEDCGLTVLADAAGLTLTVGDPTRGPAVDLEPGRRWGRVLVPDLDELKSDAYSLTRSTRVVPAAVGDPPPVVDP